VPNASAHANGQEPGVILHRMFVRCLWTVVSRIPVRIKRSSSSRSTASIHNPAAMSSSPRRAASANHQPDEPYGVPPDTSARSAPSAWGLASSHHSRRHESETRDAIADHDNSDHEHNQDHDRHIVLQQPLP
jgi:hypothetical protein